jgi:two-component system, NtrC family, nitrogen regulation sensor histidine kinase NtrY
MPPSHRTTSWHSSPTRGLSYEARVFIGALMVALPGLLAVALLLWRRGALDSVVVAVAGMVLLATLMLAWRLRNRVVFPLYTLSNLLEALREGDYSLRGSRARRRDAIGEVVWEINTLSQTLREQRVKVEETSALLGKVISASDIAIFTFDDQHHLRLVNPAGERLLALRAEHLLGHSAADLGLLDCLEVQSAATLKRAFPGGAGRFDVRHATFREGGRPHDLLVITDLSRALREEEREAWQRLIRVLGHELNNSLAPIKSMAGTLGSLMAQEPPAADWREDLTEGLTLIADRAEALSRFMAGYTSLARLPAPSKRAVALQEVLAHVVRLEQRLAVTLDPGPDVVIEADPDQLEQVLINLVKNAVEASLPGGGAVIVRWLADAAEVVVEVLDEGPGIASTENLFVPFFTTKPGGSGIGLVLARQIVEGHGGSLALENRKPGPGCVARIVLPR